MKWGNQLPLTNFLKPNEQLTIFHKKGQHFWKEPSLGPKPQNVYLLLLLQLLSDCWLAGVGMQCVWFCFFNCNHFADHLQAC